MRKEREVTMLGLIPAAGLGSRIQPLAFSKELLPVGSRYDGDIERPRAVSEYLVDRMALGGAKRICMVVSPGKSDIIEYYGASVLGLPICYTLQPAPVGLCDALFRAIPVAHAEEHVLVGLPDTLWFPEHGFRVLPNDKLSFLLFSVDRPDLFDAVVDDEDGNVLRIEVKRAPSPSPWIWGAFKMPGRTFRALYDLWCARDRKDVFWGTLINAYLDGGGEAVSVRAGEAYVDVGTLHGYRHALGLASAREARERGARG